MFRRIDDDNNGLADAFDPSCYQAVAANFCSTATNGFYCSPTFSDNPYFETTCVNGQATQTSGGGSDLCSTR